MKRGKIIYLDYAAGTDGNPSSMHAAGRAARGVLEDARHSIGEVIHARPEEIVFTGSGTEANNLAIFGVVNSSPLKVRGVHGGYSPQPIHMVSTAIEHHSVLRPLQQLEREGVTVTYVGAGQNGIVNPDDIKKALRPETVLVSVIYANNEIGTIQPIAEIAKVVRNFRKALKLYSPASPARPAGGPASRSKAVQLVFHTDACQAAGALDINVQNLGVDLMTLNGSKILARPNGRSGRYGPNGIGCLFVRRGTLIAPMILGGDQERGLRAGTESPVLASGFAKALKFADSIKERESARLTRLRDYAIRRILKEVPSAQLNGDPIERLPNNINLSFTGVDSEMLVLALDQYGICVSTGAACTTSSNEPSHVLQALKLYSSKAIQLDGNIRLTLGRPTTKKDLDFTIEILKKEITRLRNL